MAAAEARTAWQRMANRCFVQEDAKRAPKLACCPSSASRPPFDSESSDAPKGPDHPSSDFIPLNWNPVTSNLPPDTKWWLQLQPNFGSHKDFTSERLKALEEEPEEKKVESASPKLRGDPLIGRATDVDSDMNATSSLLSSSRVSITTMKPDSDERVEELKAVSGNYQPPLKRKSELGEHWCQDEELMNWKAVDRLILRKPDKACFDLESPWVGGEKTEPWWRITDKDELASLVAQKSRAHIENCDLPRPQKVHISSDPFACFEKFDDCGIPLSSLDHKLHAGMCNPIHYARHSSNSGSMDGKHWSSGEADLSLYDLEKLQSGSHPYSITTKDSSESEQHTSDNNSSRAELLEALCHSQTRAREAEIAAQKACDEKEHIIRLFFKQASHLFAYKQWFQLLQLESLYLQLKLKDQHISMLFPVLPWKPSNAARRKENKKWRCNICRYAVAFAVGLSLVGAGLLLGWTLGWLLPAF